MSLTMKKRISAGLLSGGKVIPQCTLLFAEQLQTICCSAQLENLRLQKSKSEEAYLIHFLSRKSAKFVAKKAGKANFLQRSAWERRARPRTGSGKGKHKKARPTKVGHALRTERLGSPLHLRTRTCKTERTNTTQTRTVDGLSHVQPAGTVLL